MRPLTFPNALEGDCLPSGEYAMPQRDGTVYTHAGVIPPIPTGGHLRFVRCTNVGGFRFAGKSQDGPICWEWDGNNWQNRGPSHGNNPCLYDSIGGLHIMQAWPGAPSTGYVYLEDGTGRLVYTDETYSGPPLWCFTT